MIYAIYYHCIISLINKNGAINLMQNANSTEKKQKIIKHNKTNITVIRPHFFGKRRY